MKTLKKGDEVRRVEDKEAKLLVKNAGYTYCKKSLWKKIRGPVVQSVSKKNVEQPWKDKRGKKEVKIVDGAVKEEKPVIKELTAADVMSGGDREMIKAMEITGQEDKKGKKTNKKSKQ